MGVKFGARVVRRHPVASAVALVAIAAVQIVWLAWNVADEWAAADSPLAVLVAGIALAAGVQILWVLDAADPHPAGRVLRPLSHSCSLAVGGVAFGAAEPIEWISVDPTLYVLACGCVLASLALLVPLLIVGARMRLRHGDAAAEAMRAALRKRFGRRGAGR